MKAGLALLIHSTRRARTLVVSIAVLLAGFQFLFTRTAKSFQDLNAFDRLAALIPDVFRQMLGPTIITIISFKGIVCLGYFHVAVVATLVGLTIAIATEPAAETESRFLDLVLSHALARHWIITRTVVLMTGSIVLTTASMMIGTRIGLIILTSPEEARAAFEVVPMLSLNLAALLLCWGAIALVLGAVGKRRSVAGALAGVLAMVCYLADVISQAWQPLHAIARLSPFHYYNALNLIVGSARPNHDIAVLGCIAVAAFLLAYLIFSRRDL